MVKQKKMMRVLTYFMKNTSAHGFRRIVYSRSVFRKIIWIVVIILAFVCLVYNCYDVVEEYYTYPTALIVKMEDPKEMDFPAITICVLLRPKDFEYWNQKKCETHDHKQQLGDESFLNFNTDKISLENKRGTSPSVHNAPKYNNLSILKSMNDDKNIYRNRKSLDRTKKTVRQSKTFKDGFNHCNYKFEKYIKYNGSSEETILMCSFDLKECDHRDFKEWESEDYGKCYTFNNIEKFHPVMKTTKFGSTSGLHLITKVTHISPNIRTSGMRTIVHSPNEFPFPEDDGINVPRCMLADIAVMKEEIERSQPPHGNCTTNNAIPHWEAMFGDLPYSRQGCIKACHSQKVLDECDCTLNIRIGKSLRGDVIHCRHDKDKEECSEEVISTADCGCNPACNEEFFDTSVSYSQFVFDENCPKKMACGNSTCYTDIMGIHVYYKDLTYEKKTQTATYTTAALVANLGGTLGLCLGLSLVTIVEVIELMVDLFFSCFGTSPRVRTINFSKNKAKELFQPNTVSSKPSSIQIRQIAIESAPERQQYQ